MRIFLAHNRYRQAGGEDRVFENECALLESAGHEVQVYERTNEEIAVGSSLKLLDQSRRTVWANDSASHIRTLLRRTRPDVAHFHNTFPLISPAAYYVCAAEGVPVVQTLSNYRLVCPGGMFLRDGNTCELCIETVTSWPGVRHACYRHSRPGTAVVAAMLTFHRAIRTWQKRVDAYIALSEFSRRKFIEGGLPRGKLHVKGNFVYPDPGPRDGESDYALYVGRLSEEKGILTLLDAWKKVPNTPLIIAGDGPLRGRIQDIAERMHGHRVRFVGWLSSTEITERMKGALFLVVPSICYENFPMTIVEAFACGVPVVGSKLGGVGELVQHRSSGLLFEAGNSSQLAAAALAIIKDHDERRRLGKGARRQYLEHYTADQNLEILLQIYNTARRA